MEINKPKKETYFVGKDDDLNIVTYGSVSPSQVMSTKLTNVETYLDKDEWEDVLIESGHIKDPKVVEAERIEAERIANMVVIDSHHVERDEFFSNENNIK